MLHNCNSCGDYFEGEWMKYCPTEGDRLDVIEANDSRWIKALGVVQEKARLKRRQQLRAKLSRLFVIVMTVVITVMVVCVVVVNGVIYFGDHRVQQRASPIVSASPSPSPSSCSQADMDHEAKAIKLEVQRSFEAERVETVAANGPPPGEVILSPVSYKFDFAKTCKAASVMTEYDWQINHPAMDQTATKKKRVLACVKTDGRWICS